VYNAHREDDALQMVEDASHADILVKTSGVGVFDELLEAAVLDKKNSHNLVFFWDVDAPATLDRLRHNPTDPFRRLIPQYDAIFTYGGGPPIVREYMRLEAQGCYPIYNAVDPHTHHPVEPDRRFLGDCGFLGHRLPDREERVEEFFFKPAAALAEKRFLLGGNGWDDKPMTPNIDYVRYVSPAAHNAFNCTLCSVLNINRSSMASTGFSPPTRVFEAAGAGACLITDAWDGIELFLEPGREVLVAADGDEVIAHLADLDEERAHTIGEAARRRVLSEHTYRQRAAQFTQILEGALRQPVL